MRTYQICNGNVLKPFDVEMTVQSNCDLYQTIGNVEYYRRQRVLRHWVSPATYPYVLDVTTSSYEWYYNEAFVVKKNGVTIATGNNIKHITVPAGVSEFWFYLDCERWAWENGKADLTITTYTYTELFQPSVPICTPPSPSCTLEITSGVQTACTSRGAADGKLAVTVSGATGTTLSYKLNGVTIGTYDKTGHTFTGLTAGNYVVYVQQGACPSQVTYTVEDGDYRSGDFIVQGSGSNDIGGVEVKLVAVDNPVIINVNTNVTSVSPTVNVTELEIVGNLVDGDSLTFNLTSPFAYTNVFYSKYFPNKTNYFLAYTLKDKQGTTVGHNTMSEVATSLAEALQNDAVIPKVYYINTDGTTVTLTAKETGLKFNLDSTNVLSSTTGLTVTQIQAGTNFCDGQQLDNYSIGLEVLANTDTLNQFPDAGDLADFNRVAELVLPFSQSNQHKFDISGILKSQIYTPKPDMTLTGSTYMPSVMQPYRCKVYEYYPLVANTNTIKKRYKATTDTKWVINSSLDRYSANNMNAWLGEVNNITPNFDMTISISGGTGKLIVSNYLVDTGYTGTTNVKFMIDGIGGTGWQTSNTFLNIPYGARNLFVSGTSNGINIKYERSFFIYSFAYGHDTGIQPTVTSGVDFLTNSPNPKQIQRNSSEFLYFVLQKDYGKPLSVKGNLYFYDGTQAIGQSFFTISTGTTNAGGVLAMNLSYDKLGLAAYEVSGTTNRKIKRVDLAIYQYDALNGWYLYSEEKSYRFEIDEMPRKFGILFQNALGMYDAFDFVGVVEETVNRTTGTYTVPLNFNNDGSIAAGTKNTATYDTKITKKIVVNTGWMDKNHFDWIKELLKSNNIYSTNTTQQNYLNLMEYTYTKSSLDDLYDAEFQFLWTIFDNNVTV